MVHTAVILSAGYSSRMGEVKALLKWHGFPLIEYQIRQLLQTSFKEIVVVLGYEATSIQKIIEKYPVKIIFNPNFSDGKTSSIKAGIEASAIDTESYLIVSVDNPIKASTVEAMLQHLHFNNSNIVIPVYSGKRGHPILISSKLRNEILTITEETMGLKEIIASNQSRIAELNVEEDYVLYNLNTKRDYESLKDE